MPDPVEDRHPSPSPGSRPDHPDAVDVSILGRRHQALPGPPRRAASELSYVGSRALVVYDLPLNEVVFDFYDRLKSVSKGYASFDYAAWRTTGSATW